MPCSCCGRFGHNCKTCPIINFKRKHAANIIRNRWNEHIINKILLSAVNEIQYTDDYHNYGPIYEHLTDFQKLNFLLRLERNYTSNECPDIWLEGYVAAIDMAEKSAKIKTDLIRRRLHDIIFDNQESMKEGLYLKLMESLKF
tara:strand:+ start:745 stop:1173 length:429 start_codon:yes stop_codon:yes gene_type:complete